MIADMPTESRLDASDGSAATSSATRSASSALTAEMSSSDGVAIDALLETIVMPAGEKDARRPDPVPAALVRYPAFDRSRGEDAPPRTRLVRDQFAGGRRTP